MKLLTPETKTREYKVRPLTIAGLSVAGVKVTDAAQGVVEAIVNVSGNRDSDGDVVLPGASAWGLTLQNPKGVRSHDWTKAVARTVTAKELMPGDTALPQPLIDAGVGGLWVQGQYNMKSDEGRAAFESVQFFGDEQQWSVGYEIGEYFMGGGKRHPADAVKFALDLCDNDAYQKAVKETLDDTLASRFIVKWLVFEWSDVLFGANELALTVGTKDHGESIDQLVARLVDEKVREHIATIDPPKGDKADGDVTAFDARFKELEEAFGYFGTEADTKAGEVQAPRIVGRLEGLSKILDDWLAVAGSKLVDDLPLETEKDLDPLATKHRALVRGAAKIWADMAGSFEEIRDEIRTSAAALFRADENRWVYCEATFPTYAIVSVQQDGGGEEVYFRVPWSLEDDGSVTLGAPTPIDVEVVITPLEPADQPTAATILAGVAARAEVDEKGQGGLDPAVLLEFAKLAADEGVDLTLP